MVWACIEKTRRIRREESDGDGGAGEKRRGRPKRRWSDNIRNDLSERELSGEEVRDQVKWRRLIIRNINHTKKWEKMRKKKKKFDE